MASVPVHVVVLERLLARAEERVQQHQEKTGTGLAHDEYMKHVGRISEAKVLIKDIQDLQKQLRNDDDIEETDVKPTKRRSK